MNDTKEYDLSLIAYLIKNPHTLKSYALHMQDYSFKYGPAKVLFRILADSVKKYNTAPTELEFKKLLEVDPEVKVKSSSESKGFYEDLATAYKLPVTDITGDHIYKICSERRVELLYEKLKANKSDISKIAYDVKLEIDSIRQERKEQEDICFSLFSKDGVDEGCRLVTDMYSGKTVPSGWKLLDQLLLGGFRQGEVTVFMAPTAVGKTLTLLNLAANIYRSGRRIIYYILDNTKAEISERTFANICNIPIERTIENRLYEDYRKAVFNSLPFGEFNDRFLVAEWPPKRKKASDIKVHLQQIYNKYYKSDLAAGVPETLAGKVDVVIVDYGDLLLSEGKREANRLELTDTFQELVAISREENIPILTATQTNRSAYGATHIDLTNVSEAIGKLMPIGNLIGLAQEKSEKIMNILRMETLKIRRPDATGFSLTFQINGRLQRLTPDPTQLEPQPIDFSPPVPFRKRETAYEKKEAEEIKQREFLLNDFDPYDHGIDPQLIQEELTKKKSERVNTYRG